MMSIWTKEILRAIKLVVIITVAALVINWIRTPILNAAADNFYITHADAGKWKGVWIIDDWSHNGWPGMRQDTIGSGSDINDEVQDGPDGEVIPDEQDDPVLWSIGIYRAKELFDSGECIFLDAREPHYYEEGHIQGAYNWPVDSFGAYYTEYTERFPRDSCLVVYCIGGSCDESNHLGMSLILEGYTEVYLFEEGIEGWETMEYPINEGPDP